MAVSYSYTAVMGYRPFDVRGHFLAKMVLLIFATRHGVRSQSEITITSYNNYNSHYGWIS